MVYENSMLLRTNTTPGHLCLWGNASSMAGEAACMMCIALYRAAQDDVS